MLNLTQIKKKKKIIIFLEEEKEVNLNKLPKKKVMVLNFDNHIQFSVFLTKPLFNLKIFIYVNIISHLNISSKKIIFLIKIYYACLEYCNNLTGVQSANNPDSMPLINHSNPRKSYHKRIFH